MSLFVSVCINLRRRVVDPKVNNSTPVSISVSLSVSLYVYLSVCIQEAYQQSSDQRDVGFGAPIIFGVVVGVARRAGTLGGRD